MNCDGIFYQYFSSYFQAKVSDKWWIVNECCQRIPENLSAAKTLLKYGLELTGFDVFVDYHDVPGRDYFSDSQRDEQHIKFFFSFVYRTLRK